LFLSAKCTRAAVELSRRRSGSLLDWLRFEREAEREGAMAENFTGASAAFDVFSKREKSGVLTQAVIGYVVLVVAIFAGFIALAWGQLGAVIAAYGSMMSATMQGAPITDPSDPRMMAMMQAYLGIAPLYFLFMIVVYVALASFEAAVHRWLVRGESGGGFLGLNLGADTWRVFLCYIVWLCVLVGLYLALVIALLVVAGGIGFAIAQASDGGGGAAIAGLVGFVVGFALFCAFLYVIVRLAPATATTIGRKQFAFFDAWKVTRGRFWSMFLAYLILFVMYLVALAVIGSAMGFAVIGPMVAQMSAGAQPTPEETMALFMQPQTLIAVVLGYGLILVVAVMFYLALMGVHARATRVALEEGRIAPPA